LGPSASRERDAEAVAAGRQPENAVDQELTWSIREAIWDDDSLSTTAKNVNVVTLAAVVTLRGRVDALEEKQAIVAIARRTSGVKHVDDQIKIALR
jgi:osmotically-inducible protein OsmY